MTWNPRPPDSSDCEGKDKLTQANAQRIASNMRKRRRKDPVTPYRCVHCGSWHVGHSGGMRKRA